MSKKNKKHGIDYFNMTPEEQMANAEMFHNVESGEASFLDALNYKVPTAPIAQSDYTKQIERACLGKIEHDEDDNYLAEVDNALGNISVTNTDNDISTESEIINNDVDTVYLDRVPRIHFHYEPIVGKMIIDDGIISTPISVCHASSIELKEDAIPNDSDSVGRLLSRLFFYIISCKHPAIIISEDAFEIEFGMFAKININRFIFFKYAGFVYGYVVENNERDSFYQVIDIFNMDDADVIRYAISSVFAARSVHNRFMYDDADEVESVMEARHDIKSFAKLIADDPETAYADNLAGGKGVLRRLGVVDLVKTTATIMNTIDELTDELEDDDVDDDTDDINDIVDDDTDDDIDVSDFPDIDSAETKSDDDLDEELVGMFNNVTTTDSDTINTDEIGTIMEIEKVEAIETDDMVVPVIHRRQ